MERSAVSAKTARMLVVSQVYVPDPASVGQHIAGAAESMAARGWEVHVLTSAAGYDDPTVRFPSSEELNGVSISRVALSSFGKRSVVARLAGQLMFVLQCIVRALTSPRPDVVLVSTSPPFAGAIALIVSWLRGSAIAFWAMDINPDQAVVAGAFKRNSPFVRLFNALNRQVLSRSRRIVALDRYMAERLIEKCPDAEPRLRVAPPWPHEEQLTRIDHEHNPFRTAHGLHGKFVVMYSGNHSLVHPLQTLLDAARVLADEPIVFAFIGGGHGKRKVEEFVAEHALRNVLLLPYQPLDQIRYSLSAADVHVVSMGDSMVGIVHPCKFYGAMALGRPVLLLGPSRSHVGDVLRESECGWQVDHGNEAELVALLRRVMVLSRTDLDAVGYRGRATVSTQFSENTLREAFADLVEECVAN